MDIDWTQVIVQAIITAGMVTVAGIPVWLKLHVVARSVNGLKDDLVTAEKKESFKAGILNEKEVEQGRQDALRGTVEDRKVP